MGKIVLKYAVTVHKFINVFLIFTFFKYAFYFVELQLITCVDFFTDLCMNLLLLFLFDVLIHKYCIGTS